MALYVVIGPPAAGKSTYCQQHARPGDVIVDYDRIAHALSLAPDDDGKSMHEHAGTVKAVAKAARQAAIDKAMSLAAECNVYVIHSTPAESTLARYRARGAEIVTVDPGYEIVMQRAKHERPWWMQPVIRRWYEQRGQLPEQQRTRTTTEKGLGWAHQKQREKLLRAHQDGTPCWWCGMPMYRDRTRNPDHDPASTDPASGSLAADHEHARANGGDHAGRLLHGRCNKQRGKGDRDHERPALGDRPAPDTPRPNGTNALAW